MLKKRILASSMASVMALTSISAVAFADETATYGKKTRKELSDYLNSAEVKEKRDKLDEYNIDMVDDFNEAYTHAQTVIANNDATETDITAAYRMMSAVVARTTHHTLNELKDLIATVKTKLGSSNELKNGFQGDTRYSDSAYSTAEGALSSAEDIANDTSATAIQIDGAYAELASANAALVLKETVTKSSFSNEYNKLYKAVTEKGKAYDTWVRFTIKDTGVNGYDGYTVAYGALIDHMNSVAEAAKTKLDTYTANTATITSDSAYVTAYNAIIDANKVLNGVASSKPISYVTSSSKTSILKLIGAGGKYHNKLAFEYSSAGETAGVGKLFKGILTLDNGLQYWNGSAYAAATGKKAVKGNANTAWTDVTADKPQLKVKLSKAIRVKYRADDSKAIEAVEAANRTTAGYTLVQSGTELDLAANAYIGRELKKASVVTNTIKAANKVIDGSQNRDEVSTGNQLDFGYGWFAGAWTQGNNLVAKVSGSSAVDSRAMADLGVDGATVDNGVDLQVALKIAQNLVEGTPNSGTDTALITKDIDTNGSFVTLANYANIIKGATNRAVNAREWEIAHNYLVLALNDYFPDTVVNEVKHSRSEIESKIKETEDLCEKAVNISLAATEYGKAINAVKDARAWIAASKATKNYKDNETTIKIGDAALFDGNDAVYTLNLENTGATSAGMWEALNNVYTALKNITDKYSTTYGDIASAIAEAAARYDVSKNADLKAAIDTCAYRLSVVEPNETDPAAFEGEREFQAKNYINGKDGSDSTKALLNAYNNLKTILAGEMKGDANGDGKITTADATAILKHVVAAEGSADKLTGTKLANADCDGVAGITSADAAWVLKKVAESV